MHPPQRLADVLQHLGQFLLRELRGFSTNQVLLLAGAVYGSLTLTTAIAVLRSLELPATVRLLGAQVIFGASASVIPAAVWRLLSR